jgi:hypothetical protein
VSDIIECFARNSDDVRLANFERVCGLNAEPERAFWRWSLICANGHAFTGKWWSY